MNLFSKLISILQQHSEQSILLVAPSQSEIDTTFSIGDSNLRELKSAYLVGNGEAGPITNRALVFGEYDFNSTREVQKTCAFWDELLRSGDLADNISYAKSYPPGAVREVVYSSGWIPFAGGVSGESLAVDLDPGRKGTKGQIILFNDDNNYIFRVAESFDGLCRLMIERYEKGEGHRWITGSDDYEELYLFLCRRAGLSDP